MQLNFNQIINLFGHQESNLQFIVTIEFYFHFPLTEIDSLANELAFIIKSNFKLLKSNISFYLDQYNKKLYNKNQTVSFKNNNGKIKVGKIIKVNFNGNLMIMNEKGKIEYFLENEIKFL